MSVDISDVKSLGELIKNTRKEQGLSQDDLAGISNTGRRFIGDLEKGKETVQFIKVISVLLALGLSIYAVNKWLNK